MKRLFMLFAVLCCSGLIRSAETISGTVTDASTGNGLAGVSVSVKGTAMKTVSGSSGNFSVSYDAAYVSVTIQAEQMSLDGKYKVDASRMGGQGIMVDPNLSIPSTGTATTTFTGPDGIYGITITVVPENDGEPVITLYAGGRLVHTESYPTQPGYTDPTVNRHDISVSGVALKRGDAIRLEGTSDYLTDPKAGAFARVDKITLQQSSAGISGPMPHISMTRSGGYLNADGNLKIYNAAGRAVSGSGALDVSALPDGVYLAVLENSGITYHGTLVKTGNAVHTGLRGYRSSAPSRAKAAATAVSLVFDKAGYIQKEVRTSTGTAGLAVKLQPLSAGSYPSSPSEIGPSDPSILRPSGTITVTQSNVTIENVHVTGYIHIKDQVTNVTIRNFKISTSTYWGIFIRNRASTNILIENGEIDGNNVCGDGINGANFTARGVYIHRMGGDSFKAHGNNLIERCYITDIGQSPGAHGDGVQMMSSGNIRIINSKFLLDSGALTACVFPGGGNYIPGVHVEGNYLSGGSYTVYCNADMTVINNVFGRDHLFKVRTGTCGTWSGNVWADTGQPVN